jgi:predicted dehydrogenase/threonine dehydrogenase-like Zn-dependent dehydrogenase
MKQLLQNWKTGTISVDTIPAPLLPARSGVLVRTACSLISAGTERTSVDFAASGLLAKARQKPDEVRKLVRDVAAQGFWSVYERVRRKMDIPVPRGYACAGTVIAVSSDVDDLRPGDRVACGGQGAFHAAVVALRRNLCARLPDSVSFDDAVYTTLGAIAMQGVRMAAPTIGETLAVIGLGLVGQLTAQILRANGCTVIGIDLSDYQLGIAKGWGIDHAFLRGEQGMIEAVNALSGGHGVDAVIICAATDSNDPIELAGSLCRQRGRVVLTGVSRIDIPRSVFYDKELEFTVSRSYGPGRYDSAYEERGIDYPIGYVRWTERRNMEAFLGLIGRNAISAAALTTHRFVIDDGAKAYEMLQNERDYVGIVLSYPEGSDDPPATVHRKAAVALKELRVGFIGAGSFAQSYLLPHLRDDSRTALVGVCNAHGHSADHAAREFGFQYACTDPQRVLDDPTINTVFIATRHDIHAELTARALELGKHVFVEKPLAVDADGMARVIEAAHTSSAHLLVGFNRRFSPAIVEMKKFFDGLPGPMTLAYRVNAGFIPKGSWVHDGDEGGGRIVGEVCHFIDTLQFLTGASPVTLYAQAAGRGDGSITAADNVVITLAMTNGSVATITYHSNGDPSVPKEHLVCSANGRTAVMENFQRLDLHVRGRKKTVKYPGLDKGHRAEVHEFITSIVGGSASPIQFASLIDTTRASFAVLQSIATGEPIRCA